MNRQTAPAALVPAPPGRTGHILVVDDDPDTQANLADVLGLDGYAVETAGGAAAALAAVARQPFAAILLDRRLPDGSATTLLPRLRALAPDTPVLIVTGLSDLQGAIDALRLGAADYILKPINPDILRSRVGDRLRLADERRHTQAAFRTLVETAPCLIAIVGPDDKILYFNEFGARLSGWRPDEAVGRDIFELLLPEADRAGARAQARRNIRGLATRNYEARLQPRDGSALRPMTWNAELIPDYHGGPAIVAIGQDITELKQAQEQAVQAARLAAIGQMVTGLAHESGNALARSQACLEMLQLEVQDRPEALDLIARIQRAQDHLRYLYEEVRGYAAPVKLDRETCDLRAAWRQAWANLAVQRQGREAELAEHAGGDAAALACPVDLFRMEQVFRNILENSLAACRDPVRIRVCAAPVELRGRPAVRVTVRDNGPGLSAEQRQRIFEPFYTTKTKGTGLGMPIAKRIVEAHGGDIGLGEPAGPGAVIVLTLPRDVP